MNFWKPQSSLMPSKKKAFQNKSPFDKENREPTPLEKQAQSMTALIGVLTTLVIVIATLIQNDPTLSFLASKISPQSERVVITPENDKIRSEFKAAR